MHMDTKQLGRRINIARKEKKLTGENLSELYSINATYLRQIESGAKTPSLPVFVTICKQLQVSPNYLLPEAVENSEYCDLQPLLELLKTATPGQVKIVTAMIKSALDSMQNE